MAYQYDDQNIFAKILRGEIPNQTVKETEHTLAFSDINPQAPVHILVIPKKPLAQLSDMAESDSALIGTLMYQATQVAAKENLENYRLVINNGAGAGQTVFHLHVHILGGRILTWPPG